MRERESMDEMLQRVRDYVFQTDEALKESQRVGRVGAGGQLETTALKEIREDIWALEDKVRAAKWARSPTEQAELANQIDPLMLQVMAKCQQHKDQVKACQGLLSDIVSWCERGTSAYRFAVHESAVNRAPRYSSGGGSDSTAQGKSVPSRIPTYKSPTKQPKGQHAAGQQVQEQVQAQPAQPQQQQQVQSKQSRIPQPLAANRKSLPDAQQQGSSPDQLLTLQAEGDRRRSSNSSGGPAANSTRNNTDGGSKPMGVAASRIAAFQRASSSSGAAASSAGGAPRGSGLVAAAAAAFEGPKAPAPTQHARSASNGGDAPAAAAAAAASALRSAPIEAFVPLDLDEEDDDCELVQVQPPAQQQQQPPAPKAEPQERQLSNSGSSNGSLAGKGSVGRLPSRSLLQLEPSRDDMALSASATQLRQQPVADKAPPAAAPVAQAAASATTGHAAVPSLRLSSTVYHSSQAGALQQLNVPRPSYTSDIAGDGGDFPEFGPLHSFTPLVSQQFGRSHPFGAGSSSGGYVDRSSLRNSQDISMLLRSGMLVEAALLSSNASRMHVIHDAVAKKPAKPEGEPEVPRVPARLAVHKKRPWWAQAARVVVGTAAMAVAGAAGAATAKHLQTGEEGVGAPGMLRPRSGSKGSRGGKQQQSLALEEADSQLPFAPLGPAPDASAGCG